MSVPGRVEQLNMNIRIVKRPLGEAPEDIRDAWIGLTLPVLANQSHIVEGPAFGVLSIPRNWLVRQLLSLVGRVPRQRGYAVDVTVAVHLLENFKPSAAAWWRSNAPYLFKPGLWFVFEEECCVIESTEEVK
jgi:hypothetical protein